MSLPKRIFKLERTPFALMILALTAMVLSCKEQSNSNLATTGTSKTETFTSKEAPRNISKEWKDYWYAGQAEITSYKLSQARYGELREGTAALIYVTEDFLPEEQVKADQSNSNNIPVLKLNATKNFNTGIYPYSIMTSTFYPVQEKRHAMKVSQSMQEWCGHVYAQLNNRNQFEITSHSYFQGEADQEISLPKAILENEIWTQLRINPSALPTGNLQVIPDLAFIRMKHISLKAYDAQGTLNDDKYTLKFPELDRTLSITFETEFPHKIKAWEETFTSGFGNNKKEMTTRATAIKTMKSAYWAQNNNADAYLRETLGLD